jgi:hypothetical protein
MFEFAGQPEKSGCPFFYLPRSFMAPPSLRYGDAKPQNQWAGLAAPDCTSSKLFLPMLLRCSTYVDMSCHLARS